MQDLITKFDAMTLALAKDGVVIKSELTPEQANLLLHTQTPFEVLCDKVLHVSDKHTLDMFINNTYDGFTNPDVIPNVEDISESFCWRMTEQGHDFWSNIHTRVEGLEG